jgi:signal transduction protein with GAF and PtsI domain
MASTPLGAFLLLGLDITALSMGWPSIPEIKKFIRSIRMEDARTAARRALSARNADEVTRVLSEAVGDVGDIDLFSGRWSLSRSD